MNPKGFTQKVFEVWEVIRLSLPEEGCTRLDRENLDLGSMIQGAVANSPGETYEDIDVEMLAKQIIDVILGKRLREMDADEIKAQVEEMIGQQLTSQLVIRSIVDAILAKGERATVITVASCALENIRRDRFAETTS